MHTTYAVDIGLLDLFSAATRRILFSPFGSFSSSVASYDMMTRHRSTSFRECYIIHQAYGTSTSLVGATLVYVASQISFCTHEY